MSDYPTKRRRTLLATLIRLQRMVAEVIDSGDLANSPLRARLCDVHDAALEVSEVERRILISRPTPVRRRAS